MTQGNGRRRTAAPAAAPVPAVAADPLDQFAAMDEVGTADEAVSETEIPVAKSSSAYTVDEETDFDLINSLLAGVKTAYFQQRGAYPSDSSLRFSLAKAMVDGAFGIDIRTLAKFFASNPNDAEEKEGMVLELLEEAGANMAKFRTRGQGGKSMLNTKFAMLLSADEAASIGAKLRGKYSAQLQEAKTSAREANASRR